MAKGLDIATASFIAIGWTLIEKEQFIYAFISFAFAFIGWYRRSGRRVYTFFTIPHNVIREKTSPARLVRSIFTVRNNMIILYTVFLLFLAYKIKQRLALFHRWFLFIKVTSEANPEREEIHFHFFAVSTHSVISTTPFYFSCRFYKVMVPNVSPAFRDMIVFCCVKLVCVLCPTDSGVMDNDVLGRIHINRINARISSYHTIKPSQGLLFLFLCWYEVNVLEYLFLSLCVSIV